MSWPRRIFFALAAPVAAVVFSLLVSALVLEVSGHSAIDAFKSMWQYTDSTDSLVSVINRAIPYYVSAVAVAIGFKMTLFNIGVDGQYRMAAVLAAAAGAAVTFTPVVQVTYIILVAVAVGAAWAAIAAILKVWRGRERGDLDDHAQLHRDRHHRVPPHELPAARRTKPATSSPRRGRFRRRRSSRRSTASSSSSGSTSRRARSSTGSSSAQS